jgi:hypothetical protein
MSVPRFTWAQETVVPLVLSTRFAVEHEVTEGMPVDPVTKTPVLAVASPEMTFAAEE